jgi:lipoyl(octanoyl) transferase
MIDNLRGEGQGGPSIGWAISAVQVPYPEAVAAMEERAEAIAAGRSGELVWLLEHPPIYTAGTSAKLADLKDANRFPVFSAGRGGQFTYHGPGQRVAYVMLDVRRHAPARLGGDLRVFVAGLERWIIRALAEFNVVGETRPGRVGVWVARPERGMGCEDKIAAIGIRVRRWVSFHGISLNVEPDLAHFEGIVPCGIANTANTPLGVTSLVDLGLPVSMADADVALRRAFEATFGSTHDEQPPLAARPASECHVRR